MIRRALRLVWWSSLYGLGLLPLRYRQGTWLKGFTAFYHRGHPERARHAFVDLEQFEHERHLRAGIFHRMKDHYPIPTTDKEAAQLWKEPPAICHLFSFIARREQHPLRFLRWMRWLPLSGTVLEFGAGAAPLAWGLDMAWPFPRPTVHLVDIDWPLFDYCQWRFADSPKVRTLHTSHITSRSGPYDAIVCTETLEHVPDPVATARLLMSILKPGGRLICDYGEQIKDQPMAPRGKSARYYTLDYLFNAGLVLAISPHIVIEKLLAVDCERVTA